MAEEDHQEDTDDQSQTPGHSGDKEGIVKEPRVGLGLKLSRKGLMAILY